MAEDRYAHIRGCLAIREFVQHHIKSEPLFKGLILRNCGMRLNLESDFLVTAVSLMVHGRMGSKGRPMAPTSPLPLALIMAECLSPDTREGMQASPDEARRGLIEAVAWIVSQERIATYTTATPLSYNQDNPEHEGDLLAINDENVERVLIYISQRALTPYAIRGVVVITNVIAAVTRRGHLTETFKEKIRTGMMDDLQISWNCSDEALTTFYKNFCSNLTDANIESFIELWLDLIPEVALRLRLCLEQVGGSGLTAFTTIGKSIVLYPDFPWYRIATIFNEEWNRFQAALLIVGDNKYYGFRRDLGPAKSTGFRNITYVATQLLIKIGGEKNLRDHAGLPKTCANKPTIDMIVNAYIEATREAENVTVENVLDEAPDNFVLMPPGSMANPLFN